MGKLRILSVINFINAFWNIPCTYINHIFPTRFVFSRIFITLRGLLIFPQAPINEQFITEIVKCVADCMIWFKFDKCIMPNNKNVYMCAIYMPPDKNVYYRKYIIDVFDVLQEHIEDFSARQSIGKYIVFYIVYKVYIIL
jgi:hypothetical protein